MAHLSFARAQAQAKYRQAGVAPRHLRWVPQGAVGTIVRADRVIDGYNVEVAWVWSGRHTPWVNWFTREEYKARVTEPE